MNYSEIFKKCIRNDKRFEEALKLAKQNTKGGLWLVGGYIFRNLAHEIYGTPKPTECDFDFTADELTEINLLPGWQVKQNAFGSPKFYKKSLTVDLWPLWDTYSIVSRKLEPTIENYLTGTSFTIQSIAYDLSKNEVIGEIGIKALEDKTIDILNLETIKIYAEKRGVKPDKHVKEKLAGWKSLNFENRCKITPE